MSTCTWVTRERSDGTISRMNWETSSLGERIMHICALRKMNPGELGRRAGVENGPIYRFANRQDRMAGSPESMVKIADAGDVSLEWLICGRGPVERVAPPLVRQNAGWPAAIEEARRRYATVPERYFDEVGDALDTGRPVDWTFVGKNAMFLYQLDVEREAQPAAPQQGSTPTRAVLSTDGPGAPAMGTEPAERALEARAPRADRRNVGRRARANRGE
jgi:hypothetical protein